jgi:hypothetical protein
MATIVGRLTPLILENAVDSALSAIAEAGLGVRVLVVRVMLLKGL